MRRSMREQDWAVFVPETSLTIQRRGDEYRMSDTEKPGARGGDKPTAGKGQQDADWTKGLKRLYDSVVEEPLPDSFKDLLSRLDDTAK